VTVTDPNSQQLKLTSGQTINAIPGAYTVTAAPVVVGTSTYHATQTTQTVTVASGVTSTATVDYYNIVPNTTKVLDQTGAQSLTVSSDGSTLTISSASEVAQSLQPGDVLVSGPTTAAPNGVLVKVTSAANNGSSVVVSTTPATLADEVTQAHFSVDVPLSLTSTSAARKHKGYAIRTGKLAATQAAGSLANPCAAAAQSLSLPFNYSLPPDQNQNTITASGELDFCNLHVDYDINYLGVTAKATVGLQQYSSLLMQGQYATNIDLNENLDLSELESKVVCLGNETCQAVQGLPESIGNALELVTPSVTPFVGMTGSASGGLYFGGTEAGSFQAGAQVQGLTPSPVYSGTLQQQSFPTAVDGTLDVKGYFGVTLGVQLLGSDTIHVDPRAYAELQANTSATPWWTLSVGDEADAGLTVSFLGLGSKDFSTPEFTIYSALLAQASGPYSGLPTLSSVTPDTAVQYGSSLTLSLVGTNFVPGCYATFNGSRLSTTYADPTSLTVLLPASFLATSGSNSIAVTNPDVAGTTSNALVFTVTPSPNNPVPTISTLAPASLAAGSATQTLTINGTGYLTSSTVTFNGISHTPTFVNANQLTISLSSADLATVGTFPVVVTNPAPGGGASVAAKFVVTPPGSITLYSANDLNTLVRNNLSGYYCLGADIDLSSIPNWVPIGDTNSPFNGTLDGLGHMISNLTISSSANSVGLFGVISTGSVANVGLSNVNIQVLVSTPSIYPSVGSLAGVVQSGSIVDSYATGAINVNVTGTGSGTTTGGLIGTLSGILNQSHAGVDVLVTGGTTGGGGTGGLVGSACCAESSDNAITNSFSTGSVTSRSVEVVSWGGVGGLVGSNGAVIQDSYSTGNVDSDTGTTTGGLAGFSAWDSGSIISSYATGSVNGGPASIVGGLVGWVFDVGVTQSYASGNVSGGVGSTVGGFAGQVGGGCSPCSAGISQSYAVGHVTADASSTVGGFTAVDGYDGGVANSVWDMDTSGQSASAGGIGLTTTQLQSGTLPSGFDPSVWTATLGQYPMLTWQLTTPAQDTTKPVPQQYRRSDKKRIEQSPRP